MIKLEASKCDFYGSDALLLFIRKTRHGFSQLTLVMGNVRVAHYLASFHKNAVFVKTRYCFICPPSLAEKDCVQGWTRYKSSRCLREQTRSSKIGTDASQFTISAYLIIVNLLSSFSKITFLKNVVNF